MSQIKYLRKQIKFCVSVWNRLKVTLNFSKSKMVACRKLILVFTLYSLKYRKSNSEEKTSNLVLLARRERKFLAIKKFKMARCWIFIFAILSLNRWISNTDVTKQIRQIFLQHKECYWQLKNSRWRPDAMSDFGICWI